MKKDMAGTEHASCCDNGCCKDGSCTMKQSAVAVGDHPDNCPMKDKHADESHAEMTHVADSDGTSCCCPCCKSKQQT
jgi:hypothetical protein